MTLLERLIAKGLKPRSYCVMCGRPWFSDKRRPCRCGASGRLFVRGATDALAAVEAVNRKERP